MPGALCWGGRDETCQCPRLQWPHLALELGVKALGRLPTRRWL